MHGDVEQERGPDRSLRARGAETPTPEVDRSEGGGAPVRRTPDRRPVPPVAIGALARAAGNRAVISRITDEALEARALAPVTDDRTLFERGTAGAGEPGPLKDIASWATFTEAERMRALSVLHNQAWAGPLDEACMERIWSSFGDIAAVAARNIGVWEACIARGAELADLPALASVRSAFEDDVKATARNYLRTNRTDIQHQLEDIGATGTSVTPERRREQDDELEFLQRVLQLLDDARKAGDGLRRIPVGYDTRLAPAGDEAYEYEEVCHFDPERRPQRGAAGEAGFGDWDAVKTAWDMDRSAIVELTRLSPMAYVAMREDSAGTIASATPADARRLIGEQLRETLWNIELTLPKIDDGDLDWRDLRPIHQQLYGGMRAGRTDWSNRFYRSIAEDTIGDHEGMETLLAIGRGTLAAAMFVVAELGTAGAATPFLFAGAGAISAWQAGASWEQWWDLSRAADASASPDAELVGSGQATQALITAALDSVFAVIDAFPAVRGAMAFGPQRAIRAAAREARGLGELARIGAGELHAGAELSAAVRRGFTEMGVARTLERSGTTPERMLELVGAESEEGLQIAAYQRALAGAGTDGASGLARSLTAKLEQIRVGTLAGEEANAAASEALLSLGPLETLRKSGGWNRLSAVLGNEAEAGKRLTAWRQGLFGDLERWADAGGLDRAGLSEFPGRWSGKDLPREPVIEATGSSGAFKNDLDISTHGINAAANRDSARRFLAERAGCSPAELSTLLKNDFFTSASRMHVYDELPAALRDRVREVQASRQQTLILNNELQHAVADGDAALAAQIRERMGALGVPEERVTIMSRADAEAMSHEVDELQRRMILAYDNPTEQMRLAGEIGDRQAMINAAEEGGYYSSGGTRRYVTERNDINDRIAAGGSSGLSASERISSVVDQVPKIQHAVEELHAARSGTPNLGEISDAIRSIGKYGERMTEAGFPSRLTGDADALAALFRELKAEADRGITLTRLDGAIADASYLLGELDGQIGGVLRQLQAEARLAYDPQVVSSLSTALLVRARVLRFSATVRSSIALVARTYDATRTTSDESVAPSGDYTPLAMSGGVPPNESIP